MKTVEIRCDGCGADLKYTGNCVDYRLALTNENIPSRGGFVMAMGISPALNRDCHFCGLTCLDTWRDREKHKAKLWSEWHDQWIDQRGTRYENGSVSYPTVPDEVRAEQKIKIDEAALAAFPIRH
jgi:hypothetical protein